MHCCSVAACCRDVGWGIVCRAHRQRDELAGPSVVAKVRHWAACIQKDEHLVLTKAGSSILRGRQPGIWDFKSQELGSTIGGRHVGATPRDLTIAIAPGGSMAGVACLAAQRPCPVLQTHSRRAALHPWQRRRGRSCEEPRLQESADVLWAEGRIYSDGASACTLVGHAPSARAALPPM